MTTLTITGNARTDERTAICHLYQAIDRFREAMRDVHAMTTLRPAALLEMEEGFDMFVQDYCPSEQFWREEIAEKL